MIYENVGNERHISEKKIIMCILHRLKYNERKLRKKKFKWHLLQKQKSSPHKKNVF